MGHPFYGFGQGTPCWISDTAKPTTIPFRAKASIATVASLKRDSILHEPLVGLSGKLQPALDMATWDYIHSTDPAISGRLGFRSDGRQTVHNLGWSPPGTSGKSKTGLETAHRGNGRCRKRPHLGRQGEALRTFRGRRKDHSPRSCRSACHSLAKRVLTLLARTRRIRHAYTRRTRHRLQAQCGSCKTRRLRYNSSGLAPRRKSPAKSIFGFLAIGHARLQYRVTTYSLPCRP